MAGSATVATKSYNNKAVVYTKRGNATCESHYDYYTALKLCDKRQPLPIFIVSSIKDKILKLSNVLILKETKNKNKNKTKQKKNQSKKKHIRYAQKRVMSTCSCSHASQEVLLSGRGSVRVSALTSKNEHVIHHTCTSATRGQ